MLINLSELFPVEGKSKIYTVPLEMTHFKGSDGSYKVVEKEPVTLVITNQCERVLTVTGKAVLSLQMPCARCLDPVIVPFELEIDRELDMNQTKEDRLEALDEQFYINGYNLDVDQLVGNELTLNLPMRVLCKVITARGFAIDVAQISTEGLVTATTGHWTQECQLSRIFLNS